MEENKKKKSFVYAIIAVAVLLVAIAGATYAYFSATITNRANLGVNGSIDNATQLFTSYSTGDILFENITADNMTYNKRGNLLQTKNATVTLEYTAGSSALAACTYDLVFNWEAGYEYEPSSAKGTDVKELSYQITGSGTGSSKAEEQITSGIILNDEIITSKKGNKTTTEYNITMKFYNLTTSQNDLGGKTFKGKWEINDVKCGGTTPVPATATLNSAEVPITTTLITGSEETELKDALKASLPSGLTAEQVEDAYLLNITGSAGATVTLKVNAFAEPGDTIILYHQNGNNWESLGEVTVSENGTITKTIDSFSNFMIVEKPPLITDKNGVSYKKVDLSLGQVIEYVEGKYVTVVDLNPDGHYKLADGSNANAVVALTDARGRLVSLSSGPTVFHNCYPNCSNYYGSSSLKSRIDNYYTKNASELSFLKQWQVEAANHTRILGQANGVTMLNVYLAPPSSSEIYGSEHSQANKSESIRQFSYRLSASSGGSCYGLWLRSPNQCPNQNCDGTVLKNGYTTIDTQVDRSNAWCDAAVGCI